MYNRQLYCLQKVCISLKHYNVDTTVEHMYQLANRMETNWGIEGYEAAKKYADPARQIKEREYLTQKKGTRYIFNV